MVSGWRNGSMELRKRYQKQMHKSLEAWHMKTVACTSMKDSPINTMELLGLLHIKNNIVGVPLWHSWLRIQCCHSSSLGCCCGMVSVLGLGIPHAAEQPKKISIYTLHFIKIHSKCVKDLYCKALRGKQQNLNKT